MHRCCNSTVDRRFRGRVEVDRADVRNFSAARAQQCFLILGVDDRGGHADYYPEAPGGLAGGRTIEPVPLDGRQIGAELDHLAPPYRSAPGGMVVTGASPLPAEAGTGSRHPRRPRPA